MTRPEVIAIYGGIGSGKTIVSRIVSAIGFEVYDCDSRSKHLMNHDLKLQSSISESICKEAITEDGKINREILAEIVFNDSDALNKLNRIVHEAVLDDIQNWIETLSERIVFIESAIIYQSKLDRIVDRVWEITAPRKVRTERIIKRNNWTISHILKRMDVQDNYIIEHPHPCTHIIINDGVTPLLPQILSLLNGNTETVGIEPRSES